ncbi:MAG: B12-binding domain-containing radical SAM protein [Megasphaera sp.]|jgi:radical SAM superfamily enzyme YgiQ (UPF0313 family)|uniref:B12-binding domain-containing radical SAM protein n=1 Tax=Megasphaera sueciensis TaxID=349094 RepID=UPI003D052463|nr:B12-binding domain-containing radical SAM protein [Megasphaera sp.]MCI1822850.1 B12-binding domain-containing radical SAM protein [Megasphaera sp.]
MNTLLVTLNAKFIHSSLALRCLKTSCDAAGIKNVVTAEYTINQNIYDILRHIYDFRASCIGFSCYIWNIEMTYHLIRLIKQIEPNIRILAGGPEVSYTAREVLETCTDIDYVLQGEGEVVLPQLIREWEEGKDGLSLPGVLGRRSGHIAGDESFCEVTPDLDALPFPYAGEDLATLDHKIMYYESSRGCPFHCQYCLSGMSDTVRFRSVSKVIKELQYFVAAGIRQIKFVDRTFNCNPRHYRPLLQYMISVQEPINFHLEIEPGLLTDEDLALLSQAPKGRIQLEMGIQSTYETTLKAIHRHNDWPRIKHIMEMLLKKETIHLHLDLIVGLPYEDYDHLRHSFNDIYALHPHKLQIGFLKLLKGSGIRRDYPQQYRYDPCGPYEVLATKWLPYEKIRYLKVFEDVFERIYNSGKFYYTLAYLGRFCHDDYMLLYERITAYWIEEKNDAAAVSDYNLCRFFWRFLCKQAAYQEHLAVLRELLSLDMLVFFRFRIKPDFLDWQEAERSVTDSLFRCEENMRQYIHEYTFTNWRDIKMRYFLWPVSNETKNELQRYAKMTEGAAYILAEKRRNGVCWQLIPRRGMQ